MVEVVRLERADQKALAEVNAVLAQLDENKVATLESLQALVKSPDAELWTAQVDGAIVGITTLCFSRRLTGLSARIEDVVVSESQRGKGLGKALCQAVIESARAKGARWVNLTSRPERVAANQMYQKLGFEKKETNAYRMKL
ncbi:MAG: GNAT family N-acetyltransferase [Candidatus Kaiserbacteria bacterium]|nr:MAG: GNAT family N-acetyltransferase [Candidatus Kaiserbacteria bacterium]